MKAAARPALEAALASARAAVALLEAELADTSGADSDPLLDPEATLTSYGVGRGALRAAADRGELQLHRGARSKILVRKSALEAWLAGRKYEPRPRPKAGTSDDWDDAAGAELRAIQGGRR